MATAMPYPRGIAFCTCGVLNPTQATPVPHPESLDIFSHPLLPYVPLPTPQPFLCFGVLFTQNCKCLVVTMTYCLGQCSFQCILIYYGYYI